MEIDLGALLLSLCLTLLLYGAYPLLSANKRDTEITKKKYFWKCYGINFLIWLGCFIFEELTYGRGSSGGAYILWTWVFESIGKNKLREIGLLIEDKPTDAKKEKSKSVAKSAANVNSFSHQYTQTRSAATESYKEKFIRTVQEEFERSCGTSISYGIGEEIYNIDQTFSIYGKNAGIERIQELEDAIVNNITVDNSGRLAMLYSFTCGLMVSLGNLTKAESDNMNKVFTERMQNVLMGLFIEEHEVEYCLKDPTK